MANTGTRRLIFRFPDSVIDPQAIQPYCREEFLTLTLEGKYYYILAFSLDDEEPDFEWMEGEGMLGKLTPIREQIMQGDYRALYLSWLKAVSIEDPEEDNPETEPPIPAGPGKLNSSHQAFIEFFEMDEHLVKAAAKVSPPLQPVSVAPLEKALAQLSREECENFLRQVLNNEPQYLTETIHLLFPDYLFARTSLASDAIRAGNFELAANLLEPLFERRDFHYSEFDSLCIAQIELQAMSGELLSAKDWLKMWEDCNSKHPSLDFYRRLLQKGTTKSG